MSRKTSVFNYTLIPFTDFDLSTPVTVIQDLNDGYFAVLIGENRNNICEDEGDDIRAMDYESFREYLSEEQGITEAAQIINSLKPGVLMVTDINGKYCDPDKLFWALYEHAV
jgi:hypothetical protein